MAIRDLPGLRRLNCRDGNGSLESGSHCLHATADARLRNGPKLSCQETEFANGLITLRSIVNQVRDDVSFEISIQVGQAMRMQPLAGWGIENIGRRFEFGQSGFRPIAHQV